MSCTYPLKWFNTDSAKFVHCHTGFPNMLRQHSFIPTSPMVEKNLSKFLMYDFVKGMSPRLNPSMILSLFQTLCLRAASSRVLRREKKIECMSAKDVAIEWEMYPSCGRLIVTTDRDPVLTPVFQRPPFVLSMISFRSI